MRGGLACVAPAAVLVVVAQALPSMPVLVVASALGGVALALGYRGSLQVVNAIAPDEHRGEVVSAYFVACFLGNSVPVVGIGLLTTHAAPLTASIVFACAVAALSAGALLQHRRHDG